MIRKSPYTLLELVAAVAILLAIMGLSIAGIMAIDFRSTPADELVRLRRLGALARRQAGVQRKIVEITYTPENRRIAGAGEEMILDEKFTLRCAGEELTETTAILRFFPDGSGAEQSLALADGEKSAVLRVSPLTGMLTIHDEEE